ncbi:ABC transporter substrate-binding protein [Metabacillus sp. KIGAM252]|uniref:ABC transporter substrate-binding protein n=1 Tax=Metabacillus flavus TaxID=2823519 RepID=A0ABS5LIL4_9BACI|nr:ABC transporter substrate-binding protein [Metabacillus flavus]MBS2970591.1 ABC transporter substrate-binding protein [Metabacillus flavus]
MKKVLILITALMLIVLSACGGTQPEKETAKPVKKNAEGKIEVTFWHAMAGDLETSLKEIVNEYNKSQDKIEVKPVFQGTYEEALTKFNTVAGSPEAPTIMQTFEVGTKYMIDSNKIEPVQKFIDQDKFDTSQWEKNISNYYTVDGKQYSMPFNSSTPVLVYNKDAFKKAGLDPEKAPQTYSELKSAAQALTTGSQKGFSILNYGWFFEEMVAVQGGTYVDKENGRKGDAEKATFNGPEGKRVFDLISQMHKDGSFYNSGQNWDSMRAAFQSQKIAMFLDSSAGIKELIDNAPFDIGVAYIPVPDGIERQGVVVGGASLWMSKGTAEEEQQGAWDFMKYLSTPEVQAKWHVDSGYFSINPKAYEQDIVKKEWEKYPQLKVTVDQLKNTKPSPATQGALISVFPESRQKVVTGMESLYQGTDPQEALNRAAKETERSLEMANRKQK